MKTKETSICRKCSGTGKLSKGYMNFHNIQTQDLSKEFETKLLDCIKCELCGHSWIPETSTREQAIAYFNSLPSVDQQMLTDRYFNERHRQSLTGREIEEIWYKEIGLNQDSVEYIEKRNQKQFKQFDESLFKAYIDKLPESESLNMIKIIYENKLADCKFKSHLDKWFKL